MLFSKSTGYAYNDMLNFIKEASSLSKEEQAILKNCEKDFVRSIEKEVQYRNIDSSFGLKKKDCIGYLTETEQEILKLLLKGFSYKECSEILIISLTTVKTHINNIFRKRNVNSLQELIVLELTGELKSKNIKNETKQNNEIFKLINTLMKWGKNEKRINRFKQLFIWTNWKT